MSRPERIGVVGLGYVGLPVAIEFARHFEDTIGFDIDAPRSPSCATATIGPARSTARRCAPRRSVSPPRRRTWRTGRSTSSRCRRPSTETTGPTSPRSSAPRETVGQRPQRGAVVVYESTVYPGVTEEVCGPVLERASGLRAGVDFKLGYSPERINPGDREHTLERITKVVSGQDAETLERVAAAYGASSRPASTGRRASRSPRPPRSSRTRSATSTSR